MLWIHPQSSRQPVSLTEGNTLKRADKGFSVTLCYRRSQSSHSDRQRVNTLSFLSLFISIMIIMYTSLYKVQLYITSFTHRSQLCDLKIHLAWELQWSQIILSSVKRQVSKHMDNDDNESVALPHKLRNQRPRPPLGLKTCEHIVSVTHTSWQGSDSRLGSWIRPSQNASVIQVVRPHYGITHKGCMLVK